MNMLQKINTKVSQKARFLQGDFAELTGLHQNHFSKARGSRILVYHGVCPAEHTKFNTLFITIKTFEEHLKYLKKHFNVISLNDYYQQKFSSSRFNICLTFDDGFANNYNHVLPLLLQYQIPATFFITAISNVGYDILWNDFLSIADKYGPERLVFSDQAYHKNRHNKYVDADGISLANKLRTGSFTEKAKLMRLLHTLTPFHQNKQEEDYWLQMTAGQIRLLSASPCVTIGSHGYYHNDLSGITITEAADELVRSRKYLEMLTGKAINSIAFPYGSYTPQVVAEARAAGYTQLLATEFNTPADAGDKALRERLTINPFISTTNQMYANIRGRY